MGNCAGICEHGELFEWTDNSQMPWFWRKPLWTSPIFQSHLPLRWMGGGSGPVGPRLLMTEEHLESTKLENIHHSTAQSCADHCTCQGGVPIKTGLFPIGLFTVLSLPLTCYWLQKRDLEIILIKWILGMSFFLDTFLIFPASCSCERRGMRHSGAMDPFFLQDQL